MSNMIPRLTKHSSVSSVKGFGLPARLMVGVADCIANRKINFVLVDMAYTSKPF